MNELRASGVRGLAGDRAARPRALLRDRLRRGAARRFVSSLGSVARCRPPSPSCPTRASASRSRFPPRTSSAPPRAPPARWRRRCGCPASAQGKAPPSLVIQRLGFGPVLEEAIREALPEWYERALLDAGVSPIGDPSIEMVSTPEDEGEPLDASSSRSGCGRRRSSASTRASRSARRRPRSPTTSSTPRSSGSARASPGWSRSSARPPRATRC